MKVSVIIPSYNRANLLERTLNSVINQTMSSFEIIVIDDCSTDDTKTVVSKLMSRWADYSIRYIQHVVNKGESGSRNTGIKAAAGKYVAFLDSDDEWIGTKLEEQVGFLERMSDKYDGVICEYYSIVDKDSPKTHIAFDKKILTPRDIMIGGCGYGIGTNLLIKRESITEYFNENLMLFADMDWLYRVLKNCKIITLPKPLAYYYKAPMRKGDYIKKHAHIYLSSIRETINTLSYLDKRRLNATILWYIALAYDAHNSYYQAIRYYIKSLRSWPIRRLGNYFHIFKCILLYMKG